MILGTGAAVAQVGETGTPQAVGGGPSIAVTGTGKASAPAEGAVIQIVVRRSDVALGDAAATPATEPLTEADVQPVVEALVAAGIPAAAIEILITPVAPFIGPFGPGTAQILAAGDETVVAILGTAIPAAIDAALAANLAVDQAAAGYTVTDCAAVETAALREAVDNARAQAEQLAEILGVELGDLTLVARQPSYATYGGPAGGPCAEPLTVESVKVGSVYLPPFNAAIAPEFEIYATVNLTYAIG
jgi:uncharacterized protein YggE